jgi:hypothetical protein
MTDADESVLYKIENIERIHNQCFIVRLGRVGYPSDMDGVPPITLELEYSDPKNVPTMDTFVRIGRKVG